MRTTWWSAVADLGRLTGEPLRQIARDGRWENTVAVPINTDPSLPAGYVEQVSEAAQQDVAIEALWPADMFVGAHWHCTNAEAALTGVLRTHSDLSKGAMPSAGSTALESRPHTSARRFETDEVVQRIIDKDTDTEQQDLVDDYARELDQRNVTESEALLAEYARRKMDLEPPIETSGTARPAPSDPLTHVSIVHESGLEEPA